jgi:hypothetical protein
MARSSQSSAAPAQKTLTRAKSEKAIALLDRVKDRAALEEFAKNPNKHISSKATFKLAEPEARAAMTAEKNAKKTAT